MELTKQQQKEIQAKNAALLTVVAVRCMMETATFDLDYGNPANWRVLYHNTLDVYLQMPGVPTDDVVQSARDIATHAAGLFVDRLAVPVEAPARVPAVTNINVTITEGMTYPEVRRMGEDIGKRILESLKSAAQFEGQPLTVDAMNIIVNGNLLRDTDDKE